MAALTRGRKAARFAGGGQRNLPVIAGVTCYQGGIAIAVAGKARPGREGQGADNAAKAADAATYRAVGVFLETVTGGAADGDKRVEISSGAWCFASGTAGDAVTIADIGKPVYIIDDQTVGKTNPNATRAAAGIVQDVDSAGVWVDMSLTISATLAA